MANQLADLLVQKRVVVCAGAGGVGKTTTAAALGLRAAMLGRRVLVITIDPAKRLATSLGLDALDHEIREIDAERLASCRRLIPGGTLSAMMLDQKQAFDEVVEECAPSPDVVKRVLANPIYRQISGSLAGSQEYAAMTKLQQFDRDERFDLIVVDTPPTAHALDFLDAPAKMTSALNSPALRWFQTGGGKKARGAMEKTGRYILKRLAKFVGSQFIDDIGIFFGEFEQVVSGFKAKAEETFELLRSDRSTFVVVATPDPLTLSEARFFHDRLAEANMQFGHFVVNRVHASESPLPDEAAISKSLAKWESPYRQEIESSLKTVSQRFTTWIERDASSLDSLSKVSENVASVPALDSDVHCIEDLSRVGNLLLSSHNE